MDALGERIAARLESLRKQRALSLDQLSALCGVSRATLSRLEKGDVAATAETLGKIVSAYGMTLSRLIMMVEDGFPASVPRAEQTVWTDPDSGFCRRSVSPPADPLSGEVIECDLPAGVRITYETAPTDGLEHHLIMLDGALTITVDETSHHLSPGDCLRYLLRGSSRFEADARLGAKYLLVLIS